MILVSGELAMPGGPAEAMTGRTRAQPTRYVRLPGPRERGQCSIGESLARRRSIRRFASTPLELADLSQLLWAT
jgi:hypothetical protein